MRRSSSADFSKSRRQTHRGSSGLLLAGALAATSAHAQIEPVGAEIQVQNEVTGTESQPGVAMNRRGEAVVVWRESGLIAGRRVAPGGTPIGARFVANDEPNPDQKPDVAIDASGDFVVVWQRSSTSTDVLARRFGSTGTAQGLPFVVNGYTTGSQELAAVDRADDGSFIVVWEGFGPEAGDEFEIWGRRFASDGTPAGPEFRVNELTAYDQADVDMTLAPDGSFIVVWGDYSELGENPDIAARRLASDGTPSGAQFRVNSYTPNYQTYPSVATDAAGGFVVAWGDESGIGGDGYDVRARRFDSAGDPIGGDFAVNDVVTSGLQKDPSVAMSDAGDFVLTWRTGTVPDGTPVRAFASDGTPFDSEGIVNASTVRLGKPRVAMDADGEALVVWESDGVGIRARKLAPTSFGPLVGWWTFDDTLDDASGYGNDGRYVGGIAPTFSPDVPPALGAGGSLDLPGSEAVEISHSASLLFSQAFTVSYWVRGTAGELGAKTLGKLGTDTRDPGAELFWEVQDADGSGTRSRMTTRPAGGSFTFGPEVDASGDLWRHVAWVVRLRDGSIEHDLYVDGAPMGTAGGTEAASTLGGTGSFWIGSGGGTGFSISAKLDDVALFNVALNANQIVQLAAGVAPDALALFADGFEGADTCAWTSDTQGLCARGIGRR